MAFRIYTKTGDEGSTALIGGTRVHKDDWRIECYGTVDELNSHIGLVADTMNCEQHAATLKEIQDRLFTIGSLLATDPRKDVKMQLPHIHESDITFLEKEIDAMDDELPALKSFILPGGHVGASHAHIARCVCRRAERHCVHLATLKEPVPLLVIPYLNRLSDYLFTLARHIGYKHGVVEHEWHARG